MNLIASLPWYDLPTSQSQLNAFWSVLSDELRRRGVVSLPAGLERSLPLAKLWARPGLVLSQCCGPDLFTDAAQQLIPVARPVFSDLDCTAGHYFSYIVTARGREHLRGTRWVVNSVSSRSGCVALLEWANAEGRTCERVHISGAHATSLDLLREGVADLAAIDAHSWPLLDTRGITIIGRSTEYPAPPFVMHRQCPVSPNTLLEALEQAIGRAGHLVNINRVLATGIECYQSVTRLAPALPEALLPSAGLSTCAGPLFASQC